MKLRSLLLAAGLLASPAAFAQNAETSGSNEASYIDFEPPHEWKVSVGGGLASVPRYEGSSRTRFRFVPLIDAENGRFFVSTMRGIGYNFSTNKDLQYGLRLTLAPNRKQNADVHLNGMGDVGYAGEFGGFVNARFNPWYITSSIGASSRGARLELGGGYEAQFGPADRVRLGVGLNWANNKYMQTYFGVSAAQSATSGLAAYNAGSGIKDYSLSANWTHSYSKEWFSNAGVTLKQLSGSAKNSPLTLQRSQSMVNFVVGYRF